MTGSSFDQTAPCLVLAPHLRYPARNGSDISLDRMARCLSAHLPFVDLIAEDVVVTFRDGSETSRAPYDNRMRGKRMAAIRTLLFRSHFYQEKFVTRAFKRQADRMLTSQRYGSILYSYLTTTTATEGLDSTRIPTTRLVWTHNDEFKWFRDLAQSTSSSLGRRVAQYSESWLHDFFRSRTDDLLLLHVTETDAEGFGAHYPRHAHAVIPIGVDFPEAGAPPLPPNTERATLTFVGSLGVRMNFDALIHFARRLYPEIKRVLSSAVEVHVAGSTPTTAVQSLCHTEGWKLHADLGDEDLSALVEASAFTVLPFDYATGAKLKLLKSLAHGIPFLATEKVSAQESLCIPPSLISDDPGEWAERISACLRDGIRQSDRDRLRAIAGEHSWEASARILVDALMQRSVEVRP